MTLHGNLTAQLRLQVNLTGEARLAFAFALSALLSFPLADLLAHTRTLLILFAHSLCNS